MFNYRQGDYSAANRLCVGTLVRSQQETRVPTALVLRAMTHHQLRQDADAMLEGNTVLYISNNVPFTFYGDINGSGTFQKVGAGTMTTWGDVNTTGNVELYGGVWELFGARHNGGIIAADDVSPVQLRGDGSVDQTVSLDGGSLLAVDSKYPDHQGDSFHMGSLVLAGGTVALNMFGPSPTGGNDQLVTGGVLNFTGATLATSFSYPPREGDVIDLVVSSNATPPNYFANFFRCGVVTLVDGIPVSAQLRGGSGHDFTVFVNLPLAYSSYQLAEGNGNQTVEPNECNLLYVSLVNLGADAVTITNAYLRATNATGVVVTVPVATYPTIPAGQTMVNTTPFQFSTETNLPCGGGGGL